MVYFKKYLATLKRVATPSLRTAALMTGLITNPAGFSLFHEEETETIKVVFENLSEQICDKDETQSQCGSKLRKSRTVSASKSLLKKHVITYTKPSQRQKGRRLKFDSDSDDDSQDSDSKKNEKGNINSTSKVVQIVKPFTSHPEETVSETESTSKKKSFLKRKLSEGENSNPSNEQTQSEESVCSQSRTNQVETSNQNSDAEPADENSDFVLSEDEPLSVWRSAIKRKPTPHPNAKLKTANQNIEHEVKNESDRDECLIGRRSGSRKILTLNSSVKTNILNPGTSRKLNFDSFFEDDSDSIENDPTENATNKKPSEDAGKGSSVRKCTRKTE